MTRHCNCCQTTKPVSEFYPTYKTQCRPCLQAKALLKRDEKLAYQREWRAKNPDAFARWREENIDRVRENWTRWSAENKARRAASYAAWARKNRDRVNALDAKRNAAKAKATPSWADPAAIRAIYREAARLTQETGVRHEVDHIYPLRGRMVCGLHCEANLQVLTKAENQRKYNRMPEPADEPKRHKDARRGHGADHPAVCG